MLSRRQQIEGCLLGCAVGDSIGLPFEGLSPRAVKRRIKLPLRHSLIFSRGMVSDDTDHSIFVAQSLAIESDDVDKFAYALAWRFRLWLLCFPVGIGWATLKSIFKLWIGFPPERSGSLSAGNGAAMRSAIIGLVLDDPKKSRLFVRRSSRITHFDPRSTYGAFAVADLAALISSSSERPSLQKVRQVLENAGQGEEWQTLVEQIIAACESGVLEDVLTEKQLKKGVSGYVYETLAVAVVSWYINFGSFRKTVEAIVVLGGDTDTEASIAGSLAGISTGAAGIPEVWLDNLIDYPHSVNYIKKLARSVDENSWDHTAFSWLLFPRGMVFTLIVLCHGVRRLFGPRA